MLVGKVIQILTKIRFCFCRQNDSASFGHSYSFGHFCFMAKAIFCVGLKILPLFSRKLFSSKQSELLFNYNYTESCFDLI